MKLPQNPVEGAARPASVRPATIGAGILLTAAGLVALAGPAGAAPDETGQLLKLANRERAARGIPPLRGDARLGVLTAHHCRAMASSGRLFHNSSLGAGVSGWGLAAENVGAGPSQARIHDAFMASPGHKANILGPKFRYIGLCAVRTNDALWVTQIFFDRIGIAHSDAPSAPRSRQASSAARSATPPSAAGARAPATPARRALPKSTPPAAPASALLNRSVGMLVTLLGLDREAPVSQPSQSHPHNDERSLHVLPSTLVDAAPPEIAGAPVSLGAALLSISSPGLTSRPTRQERRTRDPPAPERADPK